MPDAGTGRRLWEPWWSPRGTARAPTTTPGGLRVPDAPATDFRPVILGGDITAYSLVRTFHAAYRVRHLVVNMTDGGPIGMSTLCDHVFVEGFEDPHLFVGALEKVGREHATPG